MADECGDVVGGLKQSLVELLLGFSITASRKEYVTQIQAGTRRSRVCRDVLTVIAFRLVEPTYPRKEQSPVVQGRLEVGNLAQKLVIASERLVGVPQVLERYRADE